MRKKEDVMWGVGEKMDFLGERIVRKRKVRDKVECEEKEAFLASQKIK